MTRLSPEQREALIQWTHDPGARGLHPDDRDDQSRAELEAYVVTTDSFQAEATAAA